MMANDTLARNFKALAHPRRAMLFRLLTENPASGDSLSRLQKTTRLSMTSLVHHLREMERCGMIQRHRHGAEVAYRLTCAELSLALGEATAITRKTHKASAPMTLAA